MILTPSALFQRPQTHVFAELPGFVVQKLPQGLGLFGTLEGPVNGMRTFGALPKCLWKSLLVEKACMALRAV